MNHCYGGVGVVKGSLVFRMFQGSMTALPIFFLLLFNQPVAITFLNQALI